MRVVLKDKPAKQDVHLCNYVEAVHGSKQPCSWLDLRLVPQERGFPCLVL